LIQATLFLQKKLVAFPLSLSPLKYITILFL
jgi:hypothetical protein